MAAVSHRYGPFAAVLGHSFGALTTVNWLALSAEAASVRAAVLIGVPRDAGYLFDAFTNIVALPPAVIARVRRRFRRRYGVEPERYCALECAQRVELPVLLLHGSADELVPPAHSVEVAAGFTRGRLLVIPGFSHGAPLRDRDTVRVMSDFIAGHLRA